MDRVIHKLKAKTQSGQCADVLNLQTNNGTRIMNIFPLQQAFENGN